MRSGLAQGLALHAGVPDRIDVLETYEQFLTCDLDERGQFDISGRRETAKEVRQTGDATQEREPRLQINLGI